MHKISLKIFFLIALTKSVLIFEGLHSNELELKKMIIKDMISNYKGYCPCPYSVDSYGKKCYENSLYLKPNSWYKPMCYPEDVTQIVIKRYKNK